MANWKMLQTINPTRAKQKISAPTERSTESTAKMGPDRTITPKPKRASQPIFRKTTQVDSRFSMMTTPELEEIRSNPRQLGATIRLLSYSSAGAEYFGYFVKGQRDVDLPC